MDPVLGTVGAGATAAVCAGLLWVLARRVSAGATVTAITSAAFLVHIVVGAAIWWSVGPSDDAATYERWATELAAHWSGAGPMPHLSAGKEGVIYLFAALYWLVGPNPLAAIIVSSALATATVLVVADTSYRVGGPVAARWSAGLVAFAPPFLYWGSELLREAAAWLLIAVVANAVTRILYEGTSVDRFFAAAAALWAMLFVRAPTALSLAFGAVAVLLWPTPRARYPRVKQLVMVTVIGAPFMIVAPSMAAVERVSTSANAQGIATIRNDLITSANTSFGRTTGGSPRALAEEAVRAAPAVAFGPLPGQVEGGAVVAVADAAIWWVVWAALVVAWRRRLIPPALTRAALLLLAPLFLALLLTSGNFGTMIRLRTQLLVILVPVLAILPAARAYRRTRSDRIRRTSSLAQPMAAPRRSEAAPAARAQVVRPVR